MDACHSEAPFEPYDVVPRGVPFDYTPDDVVVFDPYINGAMEILADLFPEEDDDGNGEDG